MLTLISSDDVESYCSKQMVLHRCKVATMINNRDNREILNLPFNDKQIKHFLYFFETGTINKYKETDNIIEYFKDICVISDYLDYDPSFGFIEADSVIDMIANHLNNILTDKYNDFLHLTYYYKYLKINERIDMNDTKLEPSEIDKIIPFMSKDKFIKKSMTMHIINNNDTVLNNIKNNIDDTDLNLYIKKIFDTIGPQFTVGVAIIDWNDIYNVLNLKGK